MVGLSTPWHCVRVTGSMRDDMVVWLALENFNGISFWREVQILEAELRVHSDAVGALGFGVYFRGHWCAVLAQGFALQECDCRIYLLGALSTGGCSPHLG